MSKRRKLPLQVGDFVAYPKLGVGQVHTISEVAGDGYAVECYSITFPAKKTTLSIPVALYGTDSCYLRLPVTKDEAREIFITLGARPRPRKLANAGRREIGSYLAFGDAYQLAELVRDLHPVHKPLTVNGGYAQMKFQEAAELLVVEELAHVCKLPERTIKQAIDHLVDLQADEVIEVVADELVARKVPLAIAKLVDKAKRDAKKATKKTPHKKPRVLTATKQPRRSASPKAADEAALVNATEEAKAQEALGKLTRRKSRT